MMLSDTELYILAAIEGRELYGRRIIEAVAELSQNTRRISLAGLYTTLHRMEIKGLIKSRATVEPAEIRYGARRRYYELTGVGVKALQTMRSALSPSRLVAEA
jgi:DNA-binding PadR family transcriptional regulator